MVRLIVAAFLILSTVRIAQCQEPTAARFVLFKCGDEFSREEGKARTYSGFYEAAFEESSFLVSHTSCQAWLSGDICPIFENGKCVKGAQVKAYVTLEGVLSPRGNYGHFGMWERELRVTHVMNVQRIKAPE
jgi:hypothetical protein